MEEANNRQVSEKLLQRMTARALSDPALVRSTSSGKRLQVLSVGRINTAEGPDFTDMAVLIGGTILVGNSEFHRNESDWFVHGHDKDSRYNNIILHIVTVESEIDACPSAEKLVLSEEELVKAGHAEADRIALDFDTAEELRHFALVRLLRKTSEASEKIKLNGIRGGFRDLLAEYIKKYMSGRKRPVYTASSLGQIITTLPDSLPGDFLMQIAEGSESHIPDRMSDMLKTPVSGEGEGLRREIVLNCFLPSALALAGEETRISLFLWYWSAASLGKYGILAERFKNLPQNYLWQQQGMLEFIRYHGKKTNSVPSAFRNYGFSESLHFYKSGTFSTDK